MAQQWIVGELATGRVVSTVEPASGSSVTDGITTSDIRLRLAAETRAQRRLIEVIEPMRHYVAVLEDGVPTAACPIVAPIAWDSPTDDTGGRVTLTGKDLRDAWAARRIVVDPVVTNHASAPDLVFSGSWPSVVRQVLAKITRAGWAQPPIILPYVVGTTGNHTLTIPQTDLVPLREVLDGIDGAADGAEIRWTPVMVDATHLAWRCDVGDDTEPLVAGPGTVGWNLTRPGAGASITGVVKDGSRVTRRNFVTGGRADDRVLITEQRSDAALGDGEVLVERVDSSHADEVSTAVLQQIGWEWMDANALPTLTIGLRVLINGYPRASSYRAGDWCELTVADTPLLRDGTYRTRILARTTQAGSEWMDLELAPIGGV